MPYEKGSTPEQLQDTYKDLSRLKAPPSYDVGGPIPGAPGQPIPILAHGGEYVLTRGDMTELGKMLAGGMKGSRGLVVNIYGMAHDTAETLSGRVMFDLARVGAI